MPVDLGQLEHVDPRTIWPNEATAFTPWLAANLDQLGQALGLDLELIAIESPVGDFSCDIVARDVGQDRPVIIENQLEPTDHRHLGQLITYGSGLDAAIVIWVAREIREEHRQALDWLNRQTGENLEFFGVVIETVRIDGSRPAVNFRPVAFPNAWTRARVSSTGPKGVLTARRLAYQAFFQQVMDELREKHRFTNARVGQPQHWYSFRSGVRGFSYGAAFAGAGRLRAELYIDVEDKGRNERIFDWFEAHREKIEGAFGEPLVWERLDAKRACRIAAVRPDSSIDQADVEGDIMRAWLIDRLLRLKQVFGPLLTEAATAGSGEDEDDG